jgi:hypothetical protein
MTLHRKTQHARAEAGRRSAVAATPQRSAGAATPSSTRALQERLGNRNTQAFIKVRQTTRAAHPQTKLAVSAPGDASEREADRIAEQVMRIPEAGVQRMCAECEEETVQTKAEGGMTPSLPGSFEGRFAALRGGGQPMPPSERAFFEPRFGHSFADIRIHTDHAAGESARAIGALAYASGTHIVFAPGQYSPSSTRGRRMLAHELAHTLQQEGGAGAAESVQRQGAGAEERANDPNFLLCLALCELGIPPNLWRTVVNEILSAVSQEYRDRLGDMRGSQEFESWRAAFTVMSTFNKLKAVLAFLGESRIGPLTIRHPAAQAIRRAVLARLAERGLQSATLEVASQIVRKVALAIEVAIAAGCTTYCGAMAMTNALLDFSTAALNAATSFVSALSELGAGLGRAIARPILVAQARMNPANWSLSALPARSRAHMGAIGLAFRLAFTPDRFLASMARPLSSYNIRQILVELAQDINAALRARGGFAQLVAFTADFIGGLTPLQFVDILKDYRLLSFVQDPEALVDQQQAQQAATAP